MENHGSRTVDRWMREHLSPEISNGYGADGGGPFANRIEGMSFGLQNTQFAQFFIGGQSRLGSIDEFPASFRVSTFCLGHFG